MKLLKSQPQIPASPRRRGGISGAAFSLVEIMVVVALLSLIILALMTVFNSTQTAFRASVTQTDVQEGSRMAMDMITTDLRAMTPSGGTNNGAANFYANTNFFYYSDFNEPLVQSLAPGSILRVNVLEDMFILTKVNTTWTGIGYVVDFGSKKYVNPLYRFSQSMDEGAGNPLVLYTNFMGKVAYNLGQEYQSVPNADTNWSSMGRLLTGVVHFAVRAYGTNGQWLSAVCTNGPAQINYFTNVFGTGGLIAFSNTVPAMVELQMGVMEDRALRHAEGLVDVSPTFSRSNYLASQAGKVHLFRQQVTIPNFDPAVYP
jgi:type II secretory pathway pseudopilin PulG